MIFLSVIIPAYNEEMRITGTLQKILAYLCTKEYLWEIIVVDDGSIDKTSEAAKGIRKDERLTVMRNPVNRGKGYSVKKGVLASRGDVILFSDADLSTPIEELDKMLPWFKIGYDVVIGSRALPDSMVEVYQPWYRQAMGKIFNVLVRTFVLKGFKDTQCGFKCFTGDAAMKIFGIQRLAGFAFDVEALYLAGKFGMKIKDVPIRWINSPGSRVSILRGSLSMFRDLFKILFYNWRGYYKLVSRRMG